MKKIIFALLLLSMVVFTACQNTETPPTGEQGNEQGTEQGSGSEQGTQNGNPTVTTPVLKYPAEAGSAGLLYDKNANGTYSVVGKGTAAGDVVIGNVYEGIPVTAVAPAAFLSATDVTSVRVAAGIETLGDSAFLQCESLKSVTLAETVRVIGNYAFASCSALTEISMKGVTTVGDYAFSNDTAITSLLLGNDLYEIGKYAFARCESLSSIAFPINLRKIGAYAFARCASLESVTLNEAVKTVADGAFSSCKLLGALHFPKNVSFIGSEVVANCDALTALTVAEDNGVYLARGNCVIEKVNKRLVQGCKTSRIPADGSATSIAGSAFQGVTLLTEIHLPAAIESVDATAFYGAAALSVITVDSANPVFYAVGNCLIGKEKNNIVLASRDAVIPTDREIGSIDEYAFCSAAEMVSLYIPATVKSVATFAFEGCYSLIDIEVDPQNPYYYATGNCLIERAGAKLVRAAKNSVIPMDGSIKCIGEAAFASLSELAAVVIPASVEKIERFAFLGCSALASVTFENANGWETEGGKPLDLADAAAAAKLLTTSEGYSAWVRK